MVVTVTTEFQLRKTMPGDTTKTVRNVSSRQCFFLSVLFTPPVLFVTGLPKYYAREKIILHLRKKYALKRMKYF